MIYKNKVIFTLGPKGTDAEFQARQLANEVVLTASFSEAMSTAFENNCLALVACGFIKNEGDKVIESWIDLHYSYFGKMRTKKAWASPTKPMQLIKRLGHDREVKRIALHPATKVFAQNHLGGAELIFVDNKPAAMELLNMDKVDAAIVSTDMILCPEKFTVIDEFMPEMVWVLYEKDKI